MSEAEDLFALHVRAAKLPEPVREYRFATNRKWRSDFAFVGARILVEIEGGVWTGGRHTRGSGFTNDCEKYSTAAAMGWRVIRATTDQVKAGLAIQWVIEAMKVAA